jgi:hypothetical protein
MLENAFASRMSLNGLWQIEMGGRFGTVQVPGAWEAQGWPIDEDRARYRREFTVPAAWAGARLWLRFGAVSYDTEVWVNGELAGRHEGLWDAFVLDISAIVRFEAVNQLELRIIKPSNRKDGIYPYRHVLVGFIPYVSTTFGGPWQDITLEAHTAPTWEDVSVAPDWLTGEVRVRARLNGSAECLRADILAPDGQVVGQAPLIDEQAVIHANRPQHWSPQVPALYTLRLRAEREGQIVTETTRRFGFRQLHADGDTLLLNGQPISLRGVLSWGWNPRTLAPNPSEDEIRDEFRRVRDLGFNLVKLCLFVPQRRVFEIADEEGMLLWLELPMWLQILTDRLRRQAPQEYTAILSAVHHHPSIVLYSLGCELGADMADADLLDRLNALTRAATCGVLVCDNSGSGEAYQGLSFDFADFNDYHFYTDLHYFTPLLDHFRRDWRPTRPWIFGEFCYSDDYRDPAELVNDDGTRPWWRDLIGVDATIARWAYSQQEDRMAALSLPFSDAELMARSRQQSFVARKATLEMVRARRGMGGYVITGLRDTPISTAGMFDDLGRAKFDAQRFREFNADSVLTLEQGRARIWRNGDRPDPQDRFSHTGGQPVSLRLVLSHTGPTQAEAELTWRLYRLSSAASAEIAGQTRVQIISGPPQEVARVEFVAPEVDQPETWLLTAAIDGVTANSWPLWFYPPVSVWPEHVRLYDPAGSLAGYEAIPRTTRPEIGMLLLTSALTADVEAFVRAGGSAIIAQAGEGDLPGVASDFWGESITLLYDHPLLARFPHQGYADMQFYHIAPNRALTAIPGAEVIEPVIGRLNARVFDLAYYLLAFRMGAGRGYATTLRLAGGQGDQANRLATNTVGRWLLWLMVDQLESARGESSKP